jgi:hypothetical protein
VVTNSDELAGVLARECRPLAAPGPAELMKDLLRLVLMAVFIRPRLYWIPSALPFLRLGQTLYPRRIRMRRLSGMQAGLLRNWRRHLARSNRMRSETASYFSQRLPFPPAAGPAHPYLRLPVFLASRGERDRICALSRQRGLGIGIAYPTPVSEIPEIRFAFDGQRFPAAQEVAERLLTIPTHHWLSDEDKSAIAECVGTMARIFPSPGAWRTAS